MKRFLASAASILIVLLGIANASAYDPCCPVQSSGTTASEYGTVIEAMHVDAVVDKSNVPCHDMDQTSDDTDVSCCDCLAASSVAITDAICHGELTGLGADVISYHLAVYSFLPEFSSPPPKSIA